MAQVTDDERSRGWAGPELLMKRYDSDGNATVRARVWLTKDGVATCDDAALLAEWTENGVVGRATSGQLFPKDGQAFLDELPYMYKGVVLRAEPTHPRA